MRLRILIYIGSAATVTVFFSAPASPRQVGGENTLKCECSPRLGRHKYPSVISPWQGMSLLNQISTRAVFLKERAEVLYEEERRPGLSSGKDDVLADLFKHFPASQHLYWQFISSGWGGRSQICKGIQKKFPLRMVTFRADIGAGPESPRDFKAS